jgi:multiple sugar transport system permease protein
MTEGSTQSRYEESGRRLGTTLTLPAQLLLLFIVLFPALMVIYISTTDWTPYTGKSWTEAWQYWNWFYNYIDLMADSRFWAALWRTAVIMLIAVPSQFLLGLGLAVLFVESFVGRRVLYTALLTPMMVVPAVAGYMFFMLFQGNGPINDLLTRISGEPISIAWLANPNLAMVAVIITEIWQWTPLMFLILLAGLIGVPEDQMKAAMLLGASSLQRFVRIALPRIKGVIVIALVIRFVECLKVFDTLYIMTRGGPGVSTETISVFMYKITFLDLEWSYVAAVGFFVLVALSVIAVVAMSQTARLQKRGRRHGVH